MVNKKITKVVKKIKTTLKMAKKRVCARKKIKPVLVSAYNEFCFWLIDGNVLKNLKDLKIALKKMNNKTFAYHVNKNKNDFAKWINDVLKDETLAKAIQETKTKKSFLKKVEEALKKYK